MADEMLTGMLSKPKGPAAPGSTQNSYGGTVPSPVAQPPQTPGFQNNTANPQWWGGGSAPAGGVAPMGATSGYGSSTPTPPTPPAGTPPPGGTPATPPAETPATPPPGSSHAEKIKKQNMTNMLRQAQSLVLQRQQELQSWMKVGDQNRINNAQQQLMKAQWAVQDWQQKLSALGY